MKSSNSKLLYFYSSTMKAKVPPPLPPKVDRLIFLFKLCVCVIVLPL